MVGSVTTHEHESVGCGRRTGEAAEMANGMARSIEKIEGAIAEKVTPLKTSDLKGVGSLEINFDQGASSLEIM